MSSFHVSAYVWNGFGNYNSHVESTISDDDDDHDDGGHGSGGHDDDHDDGGHGSGDHDRGRDERGRGRGDRDDDHDGRGRGRGDRDDDHDDGGHGSGDHDDDSSPRQTIFDGTHTHEISDSGSLEIEYIDQDTNELVVEEMQFFEVEDVGWVFAPMEGSSFSDGDTIQDFGPGGWSDSSEVSHSEVVCFTPGCAIRTNTGYRLVETLKIGDQVQTVDNGFQTIRWIGRSHVPPKTLFLQPNLRPILIKKNALGPGLPDRDMHVSPQHRLLVSGHQVDIDYAHSQVLAPAKGLLNSAGVLVDKMAQKVDYIHMMLDRHEVIFSNGIPTESFHPGQTGLTSIGDMARQELFALFPELENHPWSYGDTARTVLKVKEAQALRAQDLRVPV